MGALIPAEGATFQQLSFPITRPYFQCEGLYRRQWTMQTQLRILYIMAAAVYAVVQTVDKPVGVDKEDDREV
jgi:hypothetical protein